MVKAKSLLLLLFVTIIYAAGYDDDFDDDSDENTWTNWASDLDRNINKRLRLSLGGLKGLDNLGATINQQVQEGLKPLHNLGARISQQVHDGLKPVREMEFRVRIKFGNGGTTVATFKDRRFIIRDGVMYECDGTISDSDGSCSGTLSKVAFTKKEDFCFANVNSVINNWYCIGTNQVSSGYINGRVYCNSANGGPTLLISADEYRNLCGSVANPVTYKYFTSGPLGEYGSDVQCSGTGPYVCTMTEASSNLYTQSGVSYISINNN